MPKIFLDSEGLNKYHENVIKALNQKADKVHVGVSTPTEPYIDTWIDTTDESETQAVSLMSLDEEKLTFNEDAGEELEYNDDTCEELLLDELNENTETESLYNDDPSTELEYSDDPGEELI